jgi:ankyrin repeat protein
MRTSTTALGKLAEPKFSIEVLQWFIDHGTRLGHNFAYNSRHQPAPKIKFVIEQSGFAVFRGTGVINYAAIAGEIDVIELLLDAGICVLDTPTLVDVREPGPSTALDEAVRRKHFEMAKMMLERGSPIGELVKRNAKAQGGEMAALVKHYENVTDRKVHICMMEACGRRSGWNP